MKKAEFFEYVRLIITMSQDFMMGKLTKETYISNLKMIVSNLEE